MKQEPTSVVPVSLPDTILGIKLPSKERELLASGKETSLIRGFTNKEGQLFDAHISLNAENKLVFRFEADMSLNPAPENELDLYKKEVNLAEFVQQYGFIPDAGSLAAGTQSGSTPFSGYLLLRNQAGVEILVFKDRDSMEYRFFTVGNTADAGSIIDFLQFFKTPLLSSIKEEIQRFSKKNAGKNPSLAFQPAMNDYMAAFTAVQELEPLTSRSIFYDLEIKDSTLDHAFFRGRIYNKKSKDSVACCFPLFRNELPAAIYSLEAGKKPSLTKEPGVWLSNVINDQKIRRLIIVYDPMDALAYHQMNARPSDLFTLYLATCGNVNAAQTGEIQHLIDRLRPEQVVLAGARTTAGTFNTILILGQLGEPRHFLPEQKTWQDENSEIRFDLRLLTERNASYASLSVSLSYADPEKGIFMNENLRKYFDHINNKELGSHPEWEGQFPFKTTILNIGKHSSRAEIIFPYRADLLLLTEKIIRHLRPLLFLKTEAPQKLSYTEDLRQEVETKITAKELKTRKAG